MKRRVMLVGLGLALVWLAIPRGAAAPAPAKEATVTLAISGMT